MNYKNLSIKNVPNKYLINHIVEMMSIRGITQSTIDFKTLRKFTIKGKDIITPKHNFLEKETGYYPFYLSKKYDAVRVNFKDMNNDSGILLLQDIKNKKITFIHMYSDGNEIMSPYAGVFLIQKGKYEGSDFIVKMVSKNCYGTKI